jgi:hypothetical protein
MLMPKTVTNKDMVSLMLRIGLAAVFLYAAVSSLRHPVEWIGFLPAFMRDMVSGATLIKIFAVYELSLAVWLLSGKRAKYAGLLSAATLAGIVVTNPGQLIVTFRDIGLVFMALALFFTD